MRFPHILAVFVAPLLCLGVTKAQIVTIVQNGDKRIMCQQSGLSSGVGECDAHADWYTYVFVGSISAITPAPNDEKQLLIHPEEVFHGEPPSVLKVITSQAACLPKLAVGDRWLFYLRNGKPIVLDYFSNDSLPVSDAKEQIETLRRLEKIGNHAILRGHVIRSPEGSLEPVPNARVVARLEKGNLQFVTTTDTNGRYEFAALPPGSYKISVSPVGLFEPDDIDLDISRGSCSDLTLTRHPHARISGHVAHPDGSPATEAQVLLIDVDSPGFNMRRVDKNGYFSYESLDAGHYVIGVRLTGGPDQAGGGPPPSASLYYPGVDNRSAATPIALRTDENRDNIDFLVPAQ